MLSRIRKQDADEGFTLIELLVVMIIIGILAAIAIPTFLNQRNNGYRTAIKSDLKNAATAVESYATDHGGSYVGVDALITNDPTTDVRGAGFTKEVVLVMAAANVSATEFCIQGTHTSLSTDPQVFHYSSLEGSPAEGACP